MLEHYDSILIGGSGFIGTRLGRYLVATGERVLNVSRHQSTGEMLDADFVPIDFEKPETIAGFSLPRTDALIILIGQVGPNFDPVADRRALRATIDLANAQVEPMKVLYASTALVYGDSEIPAQESDLPRPVEVYAKHKLENEDFLKNHLASQHQLGILRLSNVFGDTRSRGFVSLIMNRLLAASTEVFRVNGDGYQERDYIYVDDLVEAIAAVKAGLIGRDAVNIATGESRTLLSVLESVQSVCGRTLPFEVTHEPVIEASKVRVSREHLQERYNYTPRHAFAQGLALMWEGAVRKSGKSS